jgi:tetratricopeptide (TPR) repeat protein
MTRSEGRAAVTIVLVVCLLARAAAPACAAEHDEAGARVLFGEGRKLADAGRYAEACLKFEESLRLDPGVGTSFNLADCQEHLGRTATAWTRFLEVAAATKREGQLERARVAQARADALEPKLARWVITVSAPAPGLVVARDGLAVSAAAWGTPVPVDPGPHRVEASAPDRKTWSQSVAVPDGPGTLEVSVPALEPLPPLRVASQGAPPLLVQTPAVDSGRRLTGASVALGALGVTALAVGAYFGSQFRAENERLTLLCQPNSTCQDAKEEAQYNGLKEDARRDRVLAFTGAGIGAAVLLTGAYVWWRGPRKPSPSRATHVSMQFTGGPLGVHLEGAW